MENAINMIKLVEFFEIAEEKEAKYVGVLVSMPGFTAPEVIINSSVNFEEKLNYYKRAYNVDLTLKTFSGIRIIGATYGNNFAEIQENLILGNLL